tara:strand:- start:1189 stop:1629 length:441 start_codon:yes stop_codon:yes gene_type:complete
MIVGVFLAGCTEALPDPPEEEFEGQINDSDWTVLAGEFTLVMNNSSNESLIHAPTIWLDTNTTYGAIELQSFTYNITHLSFEVINNSVIFSNYSWVDMQGYLIQGGMYWSSGFAPEFGNATLHFAAFPFDVTVEYELVYRVWDGRQ